MDIGNVYSTLTTIFYYFITCDDITTIFKSISTHLLWKWEWRMNLLYLERQIIGNVQ